MYPNFIHEYKSKMLTNGIMLPFFCIYFTRDKSKDRHHKSITICGLQAFIAQVHPTRSKRRLFCNFTNLEFISLALTIIYTPVQQFCLQIAMKLPCTTHQACSITLIIEHNHAQRICNISKHLKGFLCVHILYVYVVLGF